MHIIFSVNGKRSFNRNVDDKFFDIFILILIISIFLSSNQNKTRYLLLEFKFERGKSRGSVKKGENLAAQLKKGKIEIEQQEIDGSHWYAGNSSQVFEYRIKVHQVTWQT